MNEPKMRWKRRLPANGTPLRVEQRRKKVEQFLLGHASALRREAAHADLVAKRLRVDREAGRDPDKTQLLDAIQTAPATRMNVNLLFGLPYDASAAERSHAAFGPLPQPQIVHQEAPNAESQIASAPLPLATNVGDPIAEATRIARSAACEEVDWSCEPLTERERRVRAKHLEIVLSDPFASLKLSILRLHLLKKTLRVASDLAAATAIVAEREEAERRCKNAENLRIAREAVDEESL